MHKVDAMAYDAGLIFDNVRIKLGQGFDEAFIMLLMLGLEIGLLAYSPIHLKVAD